MNKLPMSGTLTIGPYLGYHGRAEYDSDADHFHGEVIGTRDVITFVGTTPAKVQAEFQQSVNAYLAFCKARGEAPERPCSGKFLVRVDPGLHRALSVRAETSGISLNQLVADALARVVDKDEPGEVASSEETVAIDFQVSVHRASWKPPRGSAAITGKQSATIDALKWRN